MYKLDSYEAKIVYPYLFLAWLEGKLNSEYEKIRSFIHNYIKRIDSLIRGLSLIKQDRKIKDYNSNLLRQFNFFQQSFNALVKKTNIYFKI